MRDRRATVLFGIVVVSFSSRASGVVSAVGGRFGLCAVDQGPASDSTRLAGAAKCPGTATGGCPDADGGHGRRAAGSAGRRPQSGGPLERTGPALGGRSLRRGAVELADTGGTFWPRHRPDRMPPCPSDRASAPTGMRRRSSKRGNNTAIGTEIRARVSVINAESAGRRPWPSGSRRWTVGASSRRDALHVG